MIRGSFFQTLAAALLPPTVLAATKRTNPSHPVLPTEVPSPPASPRAPTNPDPDLDPFPEWLREWRETPQQQVFADKSPHDLHGWCQTRQATRTFRLDRMELVDPARLG